MAVVINGSGTVTGLAVGGLPDGIVKGDTAQVDKYIADCQAVKDKYPKE